jgi:DNA-binding GntR family transcriptional regulator
MNVMSVGRRRGSKLKPVDRHRLVDLAHAAIRESIVTGGFRMGERLVEAQLAAELDMSRAPIRESLQRLAKEGLVVERAHQGAFVTNLTARDVVDIYNVRLGLEVAALRLFLKRGVATVALRGRIQQMERAADRNDIATVVRAELDFHREIAAGAGNELMMKLFSELEGRLMLALGIDDASYERLHDVADEHIPVVEAIEAGDELNAIAVFEGHLLSTVGKALERLGGDDSGLLTRLAIPTDSRGGPRARPRTR